MSLHDGSNIEELQDAITAEEITGTATPEPTASQKRPNAFTELMSHSKKPKPSPVESEPKPSKSTKKAWDARDGLGIYIEKPEMNPEGAVVEYDDEFVVIRDKYPKATVHLLLIPRDPAITSQHPLHLLSSDPTFLSKVRDRVDRLKLLAASELRRQYGRSSTSDATYQTALEELMSSPDPPPPSERDALLPLGRDWSKDIIAGAHTHPSMNHLHIHILSREMNSPWLKHKKHYLSFNTSFLVPLEDFPLEKESPRFHPGNWPKWDMVCWRCGKNFKNKFTALKEHLQHEFETWKKE